MVAVNVSVFSSAVKKGNVTMKYPDEVYHPAYKNRTSPEFMNFGRRIQEGVSSLTFSVVCVRGKRVIGSWIAWAREGVGRVDGVVRSW